VSTDDRVAELEKRVEQLTHQLGVVEDTLAIRNLQHAYGYYLDKCLYDEVVDLYADDGQVTFMGGIYKGRAGIARLYTGRFRERFAGGTNGPAFGQLLDHPQLQDVIHVDPDRRGAHARFRSVMQAGRHESIGEVRQWWEGGIYENTYVRENGIWKIKALFYRPVWHATFERGWAYTPPEYIPNATETFPADPYGPDELLKDPPHLWPDTETFPFHYAHPVTGRPAITQEG
jgi:hypothetical protein